MSIALGNVASRLAGPLRWLAWMTLSADFRNYFASRLPLDSQARTRPRFTFEDHPGVGSTILIDFPGSILGGVPSFILGWVQVHSSAGGVPTSSRYFAALR